jgi:hypothetical protein
VGPVSFHGRRRNASRGVTGRSGLDDALRAAMMARQMGADEL